MSNSLIEQELTIPEYVCIRDTLKCKSCNHSCYYNINSKYDCQEIMVIISRIKFVVEAILFIASVIYSFISFTGFWNAFLKIALTFIGILVLDYTSDRLIKFIFESSEARRRKKYDMEVEKIKKENEAIKKINLGVSEEVEKFLDNCKDLFNKLSSTFDSLKTVLNIESKNEKRVINKYQRTLDELKVLNNKLYDNSFESTYISTLYELHLPKLLAYANQFLLFHNSNLLTEKQIIEFANLLEVFRVKISNHTEYLQNKIEDDFIIKMKALNEDVLPNFDGSEGENNE